MRPRRIAATALVGAFALNGCSIPGLVTSATCIDWVHFETPTDAADDADAVAVGSIAGQSGSTQYEGMTANVWAVDVDEWLKGEDAGEGDDTIDVVSLPRSCGDTDDSMAEFTPDDQVVVFLRSTGGDWEGITPWQQATAADGGAIPDAWPDDLYD